jgi:hypothetical protein
MQHAGGEQAHHVLPVLFIVVLCIGHFALRMTLSSSWSTRALRATVDTFSWACHRSPRAMRE